MKKSNTSLDDTAFSVKALVAQFSNINSNVSSKYHQVTPPVGGDTDDNNCKTLGFLSFDKPENQVDEASKSSSPDNNASLISTSFNRHDDSVSTSSGGSLYLTPPESVCSYSTLNQNENRGNNKTIFDKRSDYSIPIASVSNNSDTSDSMGYHVPKDALTLSNETNDAFSQEARRLSETQQVSSRRSSTTSVSSATSIKSTRVNRSKSSISRPIVSPPPAPTAKVPPLIPAPPVKTGQLTPPERPPKQVFAHSKNDENKEILSNFEGEITPPLPARKSIAGNIGLVPPPRPPKSALIEHKTIERPVKRAAFMSSLLSRSNSSLPAIFAPLKSAVSGKGTFRARARARLRSVVQVSPKVQKQSFISYSEPQLRGIPHLQGKTLFVLRTLPVTPPGPPPPVPDRPPNMYLPGQAPPVEPIYETFPSDISDYSSDASGEYCAIEEKETV